MNLHNQFGSDTKLKDTSVWFVQAEQQPLRLLLLQWLELLVDDLVILGRELQFLAKPDKSLKKFPWFFSGRKNS